MSVPKDVKAVGLYVRVVSGEAKGRILYNAIVKAVDGRVQFPSTFVLASTGKPAVTRVQLIAYRTRQAEPNKGRLEPFIVRDTTTTVPTDRLARLRMPLLWINQESVTKETRDEWAESQPEDIDFELGFPTGCGNDGAKVFRGGACVAADPDISALPDYKPEVDDPAKVATCFDAEACFGKTTKLSFRAEDCSVDTGTADLSRLNLALVTADSAGIEIKGSPSTFLIPLDQDATRLEGYYVEQKRVFLSKVVCNALKSGLATGIVGSAACSAKTASDAICGPWNPAKTKKGPTFSPEIPGIVPSVAPPLGDIVVAREPSLLDLAIDGDALYFLRLSDQEGFRERLVVAKKTGGQTLAPIAASQTWPYDASYRLRRVTFPNAGSWAGQSGVLITNEPSRVAYLATGTEANRRIDALGNLGDFRPVGGDVGPNGNVLLIGNDKQNATSLTFNSAPEGSVAPVGAISLVSAQANDDRSAFYVGSSRQVLLLRRCPTSNLSTCSSAASLATTQADAAVSEIAVDAKDIWVIITHTTPGAEGAYEGLYRVDMGGGTLSPVLTRAEDPTLHFHAADGTDRNRIIVDATRVYFTTDALAPDTASIRLLEKATSKAAVLVSGFAAIRGIALDGSDLFYGGRDLQGTPVNTGNIYRKSILK